jgi:hypothetical protein
MSTDHAHRPRGAASALQPTVSPSPAGSGRPLPPVPLRASRFAALAAWALVLAALQACGGSARKTERPEGAPPTEPGYGAAEEERATTVEEALQALDRAEQQLSSVIGGKASAATDSRPRWAEPPSPPVGTAGPSPQPRAEPGGAPSAPSEQQGGYAATDRCVTACQAFASMQRAAGRLCGLAGEDDPRCSRALGRVAHAAELIRSACPECAQ